MSLFLLKELYLLSTTFMGDDDRTKELLRQASGKVFNFSCIFAFLYFQVHTCCCFYSKSYHADLLCGGRHRSDIQPVGTGRAKMVGQCVGFLWLHPF